MNSLEKLRQEVEHNLKDDNKLLNEFCYFLFDICRLHDKYQPVVKDCANVILHNNSWNDFVYKHKETLTEMAMRQLEIAKEISLRARFLLDEDFNLIKRMDKILHDTELARNELQNPITWSLRAVLNCFILVSTTIEQMYGDI